MRTPTSASIVTVCQRNDTQICLFRSREELFNCIVSNKAEFQHTVHVSYLEIYKEDLRDLLLGRGGVAPGAGPHELHIRETEGGNTGRWVWWVGQAAR